MLASLRRRLLLALCPVIAVACTSTGASDDGDTAPDAEEATTERTVAIPASRLSPFCQAMIELDEELETDPPDDVAQVIIDTYEEIAPEVPAVLRSDFDVVLASLRGEPVPSTPATEPTAPPTSAITVDPAATVPPATDETGATLPAGDPFADEGRLPGDTPAERISNYVDAECRGVQNNPGPPATQPLEAPPTSEG